MQEVDPKPRARFCAYCGAVASCYGSYEGDPIKSYACDDCCAHGQEDGRCEPLPPSSRATP
jgi:hypothetical protein